MAQSHEIELPRGHDAGGIARRFLEAHVAGRVGDVAYTDACMVVSELVNNAFLHGRGRIELFLHLDEHLLRIEVVDEGGTGRAPAIREQPDGTPGGWGLRIVDSLAARWGTHRGSTHVWAEISLG